MRGSMHVLKKTEHTVAYEQHFPFGKLNFCVIIPK